MFFCVTSSKVRCVMFGDSLTVGLLSETATHRPYVPYGTLLTTILCSSAGMIVLKYAERCDSVWLLGAGYVLEGVSFCLYPVCMRYFALRTIIVLWSACSNMTAFVSGALLFYEGGGLVGMCGMALNVAGVLVVSLATDV